ncbi:DUF185-domain-containing protein [Peniophora sp. CONT]|nr:DUF185-domain-containing protein [Peniophora sp. CONT]
MIAAATRRVCVESRNYLRHAAVKAAGTRNLGGRRSYAVAPQVGPITPVEKILLDTIKANGPISFATYMQMCLSHPNEGYYMNPSHPIFGARGDFVTSPEISQVFGELVSVWLLSQYAQAGALGKNIQLIELGPGRGTLMSDVLRTLNQVKVTSGVRKTVHLVENSAGLRDVQARTLDVHSKSISWHDSLESVPLDDNAYTMLIAHEFFDALPFHLLEKTAQGWQEVMLTAGPDPAAKTILRPSDGLATPRADLSVDTTLPQTNPNGPRFRPVLSSAPSPISSLLGSSSPRFASLPIGARLEVSPTGFKIARKVGEVVGGDGRMGAGLIIDYGKAHASGDSFRAFKEHKIVDPFYLPGQCDLTVNVDFAYLREAMTSTANVHGPLSQRDFLTRMGLDMRVQALQRAAKPERGDAIKSAADRLVDLTGMGRQYMVMGITGVGVEGQDDEPVYPFVEMAETTPTDERVA